MNPFRYSQVGQSFIAKLASKVEDGKSVVLLAPRFCGKRHVVGRLRVMLKAANLGPAVEMRLLTEVPISNSADVQAIIRKAVALAAPDFEPTASHSDDILGPLAQLSDDLNRPVILVATNVDSMGHHLARGFLQRVRTLVDNKKLVAVLSGEDDLHQLVHGENSEFDCADQFVLQGYTLDEFNRFIDEYLRFLRIELDPKDEVCEAIWKLTGGNVYVLRMVLWAVIQSRSRSNTPIDKPVNVADLPDTLKLAGIPGVYGAYVFHHAAQIIARDPDCWESLERLISGQTVDIGMSDVPTRLELSGLAIRKRVNEGNELVMASPLMETFARQYYDPKRLGDLYGISNRWDKAFERYKTLSDEGRMRPIGADDKPAVESVINALNSTLQSKATTISEHESALGAISILEGLFAEGSHYVLGFREVTFWHRSTTQQSEWENRKIQGFNIDSNTLNQIKIYLPLRATLPAGIFHLEREGRKYALAARLPSIAPGQLQVVVVSDFEGETVIERERERDKLIRSLLNNFIKAYAHAVFVDQQRALQRIRAVQIDIINNIFTSLLSWQLSVKLLLDEAAKELHSKLGYKRVVFSLVDPERRKIEGISEVTESSFKIKDKIQWALDDPTADVQPFVVQNCKYEIIENTATSVAVDRKEMLRARIRAMAVAPMLNPIGEAIGTILVERHNDVAPSHDEMKDFQYFCSQIAIAIEHCERVNMLESCLNGIPEPLLIFDRTENRRYQNKPAADLFGGETGWLAANKVAPLTKPETEPVRNVVQKSLALGHRLAAHVVITSDSAYQGEAIADVIKDWRQETVGALLRIQDRTYLHKYFKADELVATAGDPATAVSNILDATRQIGHQWARLYRVKKNPDGVDLFVSELSQGHPDPEKEKDFNEHRVVLAPRSDNNHNDWLCIRTEAPVVFCWLDDLPDDATYITPYGLSAVNWRHPVQPAQIPKAPGDFWVDFPLISNGEALGKICLECSETFQPEHFELLKYLSTNFAGTLDASIRQQKLGREQEHTIKLGAAKRTMATMAHNLGTRHGSFPFLLRRYRNREAKLPELRSLNDEFETVTQHLFEAITRAKDLVGPVEVNSRPANLVEQIKRSLAYALKEEFLKIEYSGTPEQVVIPIDSHLIATALHELVQNSREAIQNESDLKIAIAVGVSGPSDEWLELVYEDNGPGIPSEYHARIFDVEDTFSRRPNRKAAGTGLGMGFIVRAIEGHGGKITYTGKSGEGARFLITLPKGPLPEPGKETISV